MNEIKQILLREIDTLNRKERRDNKFRFSFNFLKTHPGLWLSMYVCYALTVALIFTTEFLGWPAFWGATLFVLLMSILMLLDVNPKYRFEDIDHVHDIRVVYYGEWYYDRNLSDGAVQEILAHQAAPEEVKSGIRTLLEKKGAVDFYDVYSLTWGTRANTTAA